MFLIMTVFILGINKSSSCGMKQQCHLFQLKVDSINRKAFYGEVLMRLPSDFDRRPSINTAFYQAWAFLVLIRTALLLVFMNYCQVQRKDK